MAAQVPVSVEQSVWGNKRIAIYKLTSVANNDTLATGFSQIDICCPEAETSAGAPGCTISGGTVTFLMGATANCRVLVVGS